MAVEGGVVWSACAPISFCVSFVFGNFSYLLQPRAIADVLRALRSTRCGVIKHKSARIKRLGALPALFKVISITSVHGYIPYLGRLSKCSGLAR